MGIYRSPNFSNLDKFFKKVSDSQSKGSFIYKNFLILENFNIGNNAIKIDFKKLDKFCNLFDLTNIIKTKISCTKSQKYTTDLFLTNISVFPKKAEPLRLKLKTFFNICKILLYTLKTQKYLLQRLYKFCQGTFS